METRRLFRDRPGRPGPATWELGTYPDGQDDYPVGGISWYEAEAYCASVGKQLPTVYHWYQAADLGLAPKFVPFSHFAADGPAKVLEDVIGQRHLLGSDKPLRVAFDSGKPHSMIFWGPPGVGKTTLARLMAKAFDAEFIQISAVLAGVKDIRDAVARAEATLQQSGRRTIMFVDEVHRFNKAQQDAFLPFVESGLLTFIGATTENPSFEVNSALLSRAAVAGKNIGIVCQAIHDQDGVLGVRRILGVLSLVKRHGAAAVEPACAMALEMKLPTYPFVRRYLERQPTLPLDLKQVDPLIRALTDYRDLIDRKLEGEPT